MFHDPIPPHPTGRLAASLPARRGVQADGGAYHVPLLADVAAVIRNACPFRVCLSCGCVDGDVLHFATGATQQRAFWLGPISRFGPSMLTQVQTTVHVRYPCGTSLAPSPPLCWQMLRRPSRVERTTVVGDVVQRASHKVVTVLACRRRLLLITQQVMTCRSRGRMTRQTRVGHPMTNTRRCHDMRTEAVGEGTTE